MKTTEVYILLNHMQGHAEAIVQLGPYDSLETAAQDYKDHLVGTYVEDGPSQFHASGHDYTKYFKKGTPFEWCNPLSFDELKELGTFGHGFVMIEKISGLPEMMISGIFGDSP